MAVESVRYVSYGTPVLARAVGDSPQWREYGERIRTIAVAECPVGKDPESGDEHEGPHLRDTLEVRFVSGDTPMILIGSLLTRGAGTQADVSALGLLVAPSGGSYSIVPKTEGGVLRWFSDGQPVFRAYVENHPPPKKNDFVTRSMQIVTLEFL